MCEARDVPDDAYYDGRVAAEAVRVLGEIKGQRFFLAVGFWKPHAPFNAPRQYKNAAGYEEAYSSIQNGRQPLSIIRSFTISF